LGAQEGALMTGKYYDELEVGMTFKHSNGRTVTEMDNVLFSALTARYPAAA
jgi:acyl dehydratase